jgi:hypothetical protein
MRGPAGLNRGKLRGVAVSMLLVVAALVLVLGLSSSSADSPAAATEGPEAKLTAPAGQEIGDGLAGFSVALSGDGTTALVGAPADNRYAGAAWVLVRNGAKEWVQQGGKLMAGEAVSGEEGCEEESTGSLGGEEGAECGFGRALAISADGSTVLIGAPRQNEQQGAVWVFTRDGEGNWSRTAELTGSGESMKARFGRAVALSADGAAAIVSAPGDQGGHGRVWVFARSGTTWSQQGSPFVGGGTVGEAHFGGSVAIDGDGTKALIGAPGDSGHVGAAWVFKRSGEDWVEEGSKLTGAGADSEARFGGSVALSNDGSTALIGGRGQQEGEGAAWVFTPSSSSTWTEEGSPLKVDDEAGEELGYSLALSSDGSSALIGAPHDHGARGSAWLFTRAGNVWSSSPERFEGGSQELGKGWFGASVSLSGDARSALVGAPADHGKLGAGFIFGPSPSVLAISPNEGPTTGGTTVTISGANLGEATSVNFGGTPATSFKAESSSTITAVSPPGTKTVDITVQSPYGTSLTGTQDRFKYRTGSGAGSSSTSGASSSSGATGAVLGFSASSSSNCGVALLTRKLSVGVHGRAAVRLRGSGSRLCAGKLRLRVRLKAAHGHTTLKTIGTAVYKILPGRTIVVRMKLNAKGHALLKSHGGHLGANLLLVRSSPAPILSRAASVHLARAKVAKRALPTKK